MAFDPNAATARYIDSLGPAALQKAHDYTVGKEWMLLWALARRGARHLADRPVGHPRPARRASSARSAGTCAPSSIASSTSSSRRILTLPWTLYADWWREKSYGRTSQPLWRLPAAGRASRR